MMDQATANCDSDQSLDNPGYIGESNGGAVREKEETQSGGEIEMKVDEITLTVDQEDGQEPAGRCGLLKDRQRLRETLHSHRFQMVIIGLVGLDFLIVLVMLLIDIEVIRGVHHDHLSIEILHYTSIAILGLFVIEIIVKVYAFGMNFFHHKLEVFDAIVVFVSLGLDIAYSGNADAWDAVSLLILLRLWRIVRIVNGIVLSVKIEMDEKVHRLKKELADHKTQLEHYKEKCKEQESKITELETEIQQT